MRCLEPSPLPWYNGRRKEVNFVKDFSKFLEECASDDFVHQVAELSETLTPKQAYDSFRISLLLLTKYHEWLQQDSQ